MVDDGRLALTWYGHSCVELRTPGGQTVLVDPWFANPRSPKAAASVDRCDVMLVTHGHFDHLGDAVEIAARTMPTWPCIHEISLWLGAVLPALGDRNIGFNKGGTVRVGDLRITMTPADHSAGNWDESANAPLYLGEPAGFVVELEDGRRVYHTGDTALFSDLRLVGEIHRPDLLMLPIGGHYTMGPREAARAIELIGTKLVLPLHWGTFPILAGNPEALRAELVSRGLDDVTVLTPEPGETLDLG
jgi:L-ascorbate metabolism protein UlaG (beta-lactamase superfamily)